MEGGPAEKATGSFPLRLAAFQWKPRRYQSCLGGSSAEGGQPRTLGRGTGFLSVAEEDVVPELSCCRPFTLNW